MPSLIGWASTETLGVIDHPTRAAFAWMRINDNPTVLSIRRNGATLPNQTIRLEANNSARWQEGQNVTKGIQSWTVFGVKDHATVPDTDIQRSDRFSINGVTFEVMAVMFPPGEVQALCEATKGN